jgi:hypothetical protein
MSANEWASFTGLAAATIRYRIRVGWSPERALNDSAKIGNNQYLRSK